MKRVFSCILFLLLIGSASAHQLESRIYKIVSSDNGIHPHLLLLENGQVAKIDPRDKGGLDGLDEIRKRQELVGLDLDEDNFLLGMSLVEERPSEKLLPEPAPVTPSRSYNPTDLSSMDEAYGIFRRMNRRHQQRSQCYNRAHVWAYEEFRRSALYSVKLFMFFTNRYIWDYNYKWWFHVTPMTFVNGSPIVLDRTFTRGPLGIKKWSDLFIYSRRSCPMISKYSQYENNQQTEHCYHLPATMYFWQPRDLDNYERTGAEKKEFIKAEIRHSYWEAF